MRRRCADSPAQAAGESVAHSAQRRTAGCLRGLGVAGWFDNEVPVKKGTRRVDDLHLLRIAASELCLIPPHRLKIEAVVDRDVFERNTIEALLNNRRE